MATKYTDSEVKEAFAILTELVSNTNKIGRLEYKQAQELFKKIETRLASTQTPETFERFGYTWIKHVPGDPQPIADDVECCVLLRADKQDHNRKLPAFQFLWNKAEEGWTKLEIIGYRIPTP